MTHCHAAARSKEIWLFSQATQSKTPVKCLGYGLGEMGGYVDRVLADSVNQFSAMGCPSYERSQQQPLSSVPKVVIVERFKCI